jgi:hypothetical protein
MRGKGGEIMKVELTKDSRKVMKAIYDRYCERRKNGESKSASVRFKNEVDIDGLADAKSELSKAGLITCFITGDFDLTDKAIIYMENFTKDTIIRWIEFGANFIP